jgi:lantibiotic biosynthesis protein
VRVRAAAEAPAGAGQARERPAGRGSAVPALLDPAAAAAAGRVAAEVGARLADPDRVTALAAAAARAGAGPVVPWRAWAVGHGEAGLALFYGCLDASRPGTGWDRVGHAYLARAAAAVEALPDPPAGLFAGLAGLGLAAGALAGGRDRYRRLLAAIDAALVPRALALAGRVAGASELPTSAFDTVSGLAGIGAYLLGRRDRPGPARALAAVLGAAAACCTVDGDRPRWATPPRLLDPELARRHPGGTANCGLAHGIPGPLALLCLAELEGAGVAGAPAAIEAAAAWLAAARHDDRWGPNWPAAVPLGQATLPRPAVVLDRPGPGAAPGRPARGAWCYGSPGVAAALWLAGRALDRRGWRELATDALLAVGTRPPDRLGVAGPGLCHGLAGPARVAARVAADSGHPGVAAVAGQLTRRLLDAFDPAAPLGFRAVEAGGRLTDQPGLLDGPAGAAVALLAAADRGGTACDRLLLVG